MRNPALQALDVLVGEWAVTLSNAWFLEDDVQGAASVEWLGDAFVVLRASLGSDYSTWDFVFGRNDPHEAYAVLYHDERGTNRVFDMTFGDGEWTMSREDPDMHQRFIASVEPGRITGRWEASEDFGQTWRKDFDLTFERR
jgi:hypothetical protein